MTTEGLTDALVSISRRNCQWVEMFVALKLSQASLWPAENKLSMHNEDTDEIIGLVFSLQM